MSSGKKSQNGKQVINTKVSTRAQEQGGDREGERERESQAGSTFSRKPAAGVKPTNREILTWAEIKSQTLHQLNHPGAPLWKIF